MAVNLARNKGPKLVKLNVPNIETFTLFGWQVFRRGDIFHLKNNNKKYKKK